MGSLQSTKLLIMHPKYNALFTSVNLLLGTGPLILPMPFFNAGVGLSSIWMVIVCLLSYTSAMFISESMSKLHQITYNQERLSLQNSLITNEEQDQVGDEEIQKVETKQFDHSEQFRILYGEKWRYFPTIAITVYLLGTSVSKCIMTASTLEKVFKGIDAPAIVASFEFWLIIFFLAGAIFSFRSIDKTKVMQVIIVGVRFISIFFFIGGAIFLFSRDGIKKLTPEGKGFFNFDKFVEIFSDSVFALMAHHSLPSIVSTLHTTEDVSFVFRNSFMISGVILMIIPLTGAMAFGSELGTGDTLIYYNFDFKSKIDFIYWFTSFYVFLNIAAFSVYIIVIRTNILNAINPKINAKVLSKTTLFTSLVILALILLMSWWLQKKIQIVLDFTGGIFGIFILFIMPAMEVWKARKMLLGNGPKNFITWLPVLFAVLGFIFMGFNLYHIISKLIG